MAVITLGYFTDAVLGVIGVLRSKNDAVAGRGVKILPCKDSVKVNPIDFLIALCVI